MTITFQRDDLIKPLGYVAGVVERRQTLPILSYLLLRSAQDITLTGTDLEVEVTVTASAKTSTPGEWMLPARKLLDICRALPADASVEIKPEGTKVLVRAGRSRFSLATLPVSDFPVAPQADFENRFEIEREVLRKLLGDVHFCMAQQDVRYYLNGVLLEVAGATIKAVATDGHRLAVSEAAVANHQGEPRQVIVPRKGVQELIRLLETGDGMAKVEIGKNHVRVSTDGLGFTSKLIDGRYPDYGKVIPQQQGKLLSLGRESLRETLARVAILSNEKYRGVRLVLGNNNLQISAHNPEQEEALEELALQYQGENLEIGFNVSYLLDALGALKCDDIVLGLNDANSSCTIQAPGTQTPKYVIMPMRL